MARYIDIDNAIPIMLKAVVDIVGHGITQVDAANIALMLEDASTADVVPKSEVDWNSIPVDVSEALKQRAVEKAKTEVAREIFEEIERICLKHIDRYNRYIMCCEKFAELKKKYTEVENGTQ